MIVKARFPDKLGFLFEEHRYKVLYGGRGSGKSHAAAMFLLLKGIESPCRILCTREVQKSIKDSVHQLLKAKIEELGLLSEYEVLDTIIRGKNGTEFIFSGLSNQTAGSIKSFEGISYCWCEEAQTISKSSWDILIPTIRKPGSEFIITFNPCLDTDDTYRRFVLAPPPDCVSVALNHTDNPWFPDVLEQERLHFQATEPEEDYNNIWEGQCRSAVAGAIYASEVSKAIAGQRICNLPYDPMLKVHVVLDLGFGDGMSVGFFQRLRNEVRCIEHFYERHKRTQEIAAMCKQRLYNYGKVFLPHDGFHEVRQGKNDADVFRAHNFQVLQTPNIPREDGIRNARNCFPQFYFDRVYAAGLVESLKRYRRVDTKSGGDGMPAHDPVISDDADMFRYASLNLDRMTNEDEVAALPEVPMPVAYNRMGM